VNTYPAERKEALQRRMMPPENKKVSELARETGITEQTLYTWRRQLNGQGIAMPSNGKNSEQWSSEDKFAVVLETAAMSVAELAEYCRRKGLYAEQIAAWRKNCSGANASVVQADKGQREQSKGDHKRIRVLEKELNRKEKALAEVAALLVLRKKAQAIWGEQAED
jgi:transposase-like protein